MLDLETFGDIPNAVMIQIGACYFDRATGEIGEKFLANIDVESSLKEGFEVTGSTLYWWLRQDKKAQLSLLEKPLNVVDALFAFSMFMERAKYIWSHVTFDCVILMNHFRKLGIHPKVHPYKIARDLNTLIHLINTNRSDYTRGGIHHNALDDCIYQVQYAVDALNIITGVSK